LAVLGLASVILWGLILVAFQLLMR